MAHSFQRSAHSLYASVTQRAFTLIEMIVICGILVLVSGVLLANNNQFGGVVQLDNLAYDIGLTVRQAQVYGISVARFGTNDYSAGYGMHFSIGEPISYKLFGDLSGNGIYDSGELLDGGETVIRGNYKIVDLIVINSLGSINDGIVTLDVLFKRPEPDAWISADSASCTLQTANCYHEACIVVQSPKGERRSVVVNINGQISVRKTCD